jgi:hypothetical protein
VVQESEIIPARAYVDGYTFNRLSSDVNGVAVLAFKKNAAGEFVETRFGIVIGELEFSISPFEPDVAMSAHMKRRDELNEQRRAHKEQNHQDKMRRQAELRQTASHVGSKEATDAVARQKAAAAPSAGASTKGYDVIKKTKNGAYVKGEGGKRTWVANEKLSANEQAKNKPKATKGHGRERAHGGGRRGR